METPSRSGHNTANSNEKSAFARGSSRRLNEAGFTLAELIVAATIGGVVCIFVGYLVFISTISQAGAINRLGSESQLLIIESLVKRTMRQAVNIYKFGMGPGGWVRPFDSTNPADPTINFALFQREAARMPVINDPWYEGMSALRNSGLFFIRPTATTQGVLFVSSRSLEEPDGDVAPSYNQTYAGHITSIRVPDAQFVTDANFQLRSVDIEVTVRYFMADVPLAERCYLPVCVGGAKAGIDETRVFTVLFRNNNFGANVTTGRPMYGLSGNPIYFFSDFGGRLVR